jgi:hypothetical protein
MNKFLLPGILAGFLLFLPSRSQAVPLDVPYQILVTTTNNTGTLVISTANFPSGSTAINANVATSQWCISKALVSCAVPANFSMFWSTSTITSGTTDYMVTTATAVPFDTNFTYRTPYCAPVGQPILTLKSNVAQSTITVQGYLFKGGNP